MLSFILISINENKYFLRRYQVLAAFNKFKIMFVYNMSEMTPTLSFLIDMESQCLN